MSNEEDLDRMLKVTEIPALGYAQLFLQLGGFLLILSFFGLPVATYFSVPAVEGQSAIPQMAGGAFSGCCSALLGVANFSAARGLKQGRKWGWGLSLVLGVMYLVSCTCFPVGAVLLYALLRQDSRDLYLG